MWYVIIISIILVALHIIYTLKAQSVISSALVLTKKQKVINSILIWLIPFVWYFLIKDFIIIDQRIMTKKRREKLRKKEERFFYESEKGIWG